MIVVVLAACLSSSSAWASHFRFGHITWEQIGPNRARFEYVLGMRQFGPFAVGEVSSSLTVVDFGDGTAINPSFTVNFISGSDVNDDWFLAKAVFEHEFTGPGPFMVSDPGCCRQISLQHVNNPDGAWRVSTVVDFAKTTASPRSLLPAIVGCPVAGVCRFNITALDPDGGRLSYRLANPSEWDSSVAPTNIQPGPPHAPNAATVDASTGIYTWDTTGATLKPPGIPTLYSTQVIIEDRDQVTGALNGSSAIDFMIQIGGTVTTNPPVFDVPPTPASGATFEVSVGETLTFPVQASDPDASDTVTLSAIGLPAGALFAPPGVGNPVGGTFTWTPAPADIGAALVVVFQAVDNNGSAAAPHSIAIRVRTNRPPVAVCQSVTVAADAQCRGCASVNNGSSDPDGDLLTLAEAPVCPFPLGATSVTLTARDPQGASASCSGLVTVVDRTGPAIACNAPTRIDERDSTRWLTATATDNCGPVKARITGYDCRQAGRHSDDDHRNNKKCRVQISGDKIKILDSGKAGTVITWTVTSTDASGNASNQTCTMQVERCR